MPAWVLQIQYAETFGCHPQEVGNAVKVRWWNRWLLFARARNARGIWDRFNQPNGATSLSKEDNEERFWTMDKEKY